MDSKILATIWAAETFILTFSFGIVTVKAFGLMSKCVITV